MSNRDDKMDFPCVTIALGESSESSEVKTMGDLSTEVTQLIPNKINKPVPYVIKPNDGAYDSNTGIWSFTDKTLNLTLVATGMVLVDPATGTGAKILGASAGGISLGSGLSLTATKLGVIPQYQFYEAKVGHAFFNESYVIGTHAMDQQTSLWLHSIVMYSLLRYRQALLEQNGFAQTVIKNSKMYPNGDYSDNSQVIWSRDITVSGQTENTWIMAPHRFIETVNVPTAPDSSGYVGGIKILSNQNTQGDLGSLDWTTIVDELDRS